MKIGALSSVLGAEITGIDISRPLDRDTVDELIDALFTHFQAERLKKELVA